MKYINYSEETKKSNNTFPIYHEPEPSRKTTGFVRSIYDSKIVVTPVAESKNNVQFENLTMRTAFSDFWTALNHNGSMADFCIIGITAGIDGMHHKYPCKITTYNNEIDYLFSINDKHSFHVRKVLDDENHAKEIYYREIDDYCNMTQIGKLWKEDQDNMIKQSYFVQDFGSNSVLFELSSNRFNLSSNEKTSLSFEISSFESDLLTISAMGTPDNYDICKASVSIDFPKKVTDVKLKTQSSEELINKFRELYANNELPKTHETFKSSGDKINYDFHVLPTEFFNDSNFNFPAFNEAEINQHLMPKKAYVKPTAIIEKF